MTSDEGTIATVSTYPGPSPVRFCSSRKACVSRISDCSWSGQRKRQHQKQQIKRGHCCVARGIDGAHMLPEQRTAVEIYVGVWQIACKSFVGPNRGLQNPVNTSSTGTTINYHYPQEGPPHLLLCLLLGSLLSNCPAHFVGVSFHRQPLCFAHMRPILLLL